MLSEKTIQMIRSTGMTVKREPRINFGTKHRGDAMYMSNGIVHINDTTVVSPTKENTIPLASKTPGHAMAEAKRQKLKGYAKFLSTKGTSLTILAYEVFGAMSEEVTHLVQRLNYEMNRQAPEDATWNTATFYTYWIKALSVTLHRGTAMAAIRIAEDILTNCRPSDRETRHLLEVQPIPVVDDEVSTTAQGSPDRDESGDLIW